MEPIEPDLAGGGLTVVDYLRPVWRFKFVVVLVVVLAAAATYFYTNREAKSYQTSTELYIGQSSFQQLLNPTALPPTDRTIADQAQLLTTPEIADVVRSRLKLYRYSPQALLGVITVTPNSQSDFLTIAAQGGDPSLIAEVANGFAAAYLQVSNRDLVNSARVALQTAEARLHGLAPGNANAAARTGLQQQISTLEGAVVSPPASGQQLSPAPVPAVPTSPNPEQDAIFAAAIALVLAVIVAYLIDRSDRRVRRLDELESLFHLPVLVALPRIRRATLTGNDRHRTSPGLREPYRTLRVNLDIARKAHDARVILVTSALAGEGKSSVVRNLAISYREAGERVAIVEADLRRPVLAEEFGIDPQPGLAEALGHGEALHVQRAPDPTVERNGSSGEIDVVVASTVSDDPTALLTETRLRGVIRQLAPYHHIVLVDSPPLLAVGDGLTLLSSVDAVLLVVRGGTSTRAAATRVRRTIDRVNESHRVVPLGVVANGVADDLAPYERYEHVGAEDKSLASTADPAAR